MPTYLFLQQASSAPTAGPAPTGTAEPGDRSTSFRPVEGGNEMQSGDKLLAEAYIAFWVFAFLFLLASWRRQRNLDARITLLEGEIRKVRDKQAGGA